MSVKLKEAEFDSFCSQEGKTVLVDFYADWCHPCKMLSPVLDGIEEENPEGIVLGKVNIDEEPALADKFRVNSIPTVLVIRNGKVKERFSGYRDKESVLGILARSEA